jgi:hypothetical protein
MLIVTLPEEPWVTVSDGALALSTKSDATLTVMPPDVMPE